MNKINMSAVIAGTLAIVTVVAFQNCSKVQVTPIDDASTSAGANGGNGNGDDFGGDGGFGGTGGSAGGSAGTDGGYTVPPGAKTESFPFTPDRKADIILVIDNSTSMQPEANKLAQRFYVFINQLKTLGINWQMCVVTTDIYNNKGNALPWSGLGKVVFSKADADSRTDAQMTSIFANTFNGLFPGPADSGDERGIAALSRNVDQQGSNGCYRAGSVVAPIILSDEDERSWGGDQVLYNWEKDLAAANNKPLPAAANLPLQNEDKASVYFDKMRAQGFGKFMVSSIIVNNDACRDSQQATLDGSGKWYPAYVGKQYGLLSNLTGGVINSICNTDYSNGLLSFASRIGSSNNTFKLLCVPKAGTLLVTSPGLSQPNDYQTSLVGQNLTISSARGTGFDVKLDYVCQ